MPIVDENRLKGNYGATYVALRLSSECLVRPVAAETDVGVDLYCETVEGGTPIPSLLGPSQSRGSMSAVSRPRDRILCIQC